jgi:hypothetical protein
MMIDHKYDPPVTWLMSENVSDLLRYAISYLFTDSDFARRIKNALELTHYADTHANEAIALSFCVSALEALLCDKKDKKVRQLQERIPALLQATTTLAKESAPAVKRLYNARSSCLHGSRLSTESGHTIAARRLAAAVVRGALEWAIHNGDNPWDTSDKDWLQELRRATVHGKVCKVAGVTPELAEHLDEFQRVFRQRPI